MRFKIENILHNNAKNLIIDRCFKIQQHLREQYLAKTYGIYLIIGRTLCSYKKIFNLLSKRCNTQILLNFSELR